MIPTHEPNGLLPVGIHEASWTEVVARFGWSPRRALLLGLVVEALRHFADAGCEVVYLAGSFVTTKERPGDIDVAWDEAGVDPAILHPVFWGSFEGRQLTKMRFGAEFLPANETERDTQMTFLEFFQTHKVGPRRGILMVRLDTLEE